MDCIIHDTFVLDQPRKRTHTQFRLRKEHILPHETVLKNLEEQRDNLIVQIEKTDSEIKKSTLLNTLKNMDHDIQTLGTSMTKSGRIVKRPKLFHTLEFVPGFSKKKGAITDRGKSIV